MPQIVIDLTFFDRLATALVTATPLEVIKGFFLYGGWIPFAWVFWYGFSHMWLHSREHHYAHGIKYILLAVSIQKNNEQSPKAVEHIFTHLAGTFSSPNFKEKWLDGKFTPAFSFEYVSIDGYTQFMIRCAVQYRDLVEAAVFSQYPDAEISEIPDYTQNVPLNHPNPEWDCWGTEFVLAKPSAFPIRTWVEFEHSLSQEFKDPLASLLETMSRLKKGEQVWLQILLFPRDQSWMQDSVKLVKKMTGREVKSKPPMWAQGIDAVFNLAGEVVTAAVGGGGEAGKKPEAKKDEPLRMLAMSPGEKKVIEGIENKLSKIGFGVKFRFVYVGKRNVFRKGPMISMVRGAIGLLGSLDGNSFKGYGPVTPKTDYFWQRWSTEGKKTRIIRNYADRSSNGATPYVLNVEELATLWHPPAMLVRAPLIKKVESRKVEPPFSLPQSPEDVE